MRRDKPGEPVTGALRIYDSVSREIGTFFNLFSRDADLLLPKLRAAQRLVESGTDRLQTIDRELVMLSVTGNEKEPHPRPL